MTRKRLYRYGWIPFLAATIVTGIWTGQLDGEARAASSQYDVPAEIVEAADYWGEKNNICPELLEAMAFYESSYDPGARNGECIGLMQVNERLHRDRMERLGAWDLTDIGDNMAVAADYMAELFGTYGDPALVLVAYNGDSRLEGMAERGESMSEYADNILTMAAELERIHGK